MTTNNKHSNIKNDHFCGLWSEFLATDPQVPGSIPWHYKKKEK
jgi:hypothetical protein